MRVVCHHHHMQQGSGQCAARPLSVAAECVEERQSSCQDAHALRGDAPMQLRWSHPTITVSGLAWSGERENRCGVCRGAGWTGDAFLSFLLTRPKYFGYTYNITIRSFTPEVILLIL